METKHTPGPWRFYTEPQPNGCPIIGVGHGMMVAMLAHTVKQEDQKDEAIANARLISAAPELLGALYGMLEVYGGQRDADGLPKHATELDLIASARAAIAKATGA